MQLIGEPAAAALLELGTAVTRLVRAHAARARPAGLTLAEIRALGAARQEIVQLLASRLSVVTAADARSLAHLTRLIVPALRPDAAR